MDSHLTQHVFFDFQGAPNVRVRLSAAEPAAEPGAEPGGEPEAAPGRFPFTAPVAIIGSIPPSASAAQSVGRDLLGGLARDLRERGIGYLSGVAADHDREWVERVLIVDCSEEWQVRHAAMVHLQPFITVWRETDGYGILEVLDVRPGAPGQPVAQRPAALHKVSARTCPMSAHTRSGDLCRMAGGPWTSGSIHYAGAWETKRGRMIDALGCDTCGDGQIKVALGGVGPGARQTTRVGAWPPAQTRHDEAVAPAEDSA